MKYISAIALLLFAATIITSCESVNEEPPRTENVTFLKYKMPEPEPLNGDEQAVVNEIEKEYKESTK
ncbi:MAG: hypothetical protein Q3992_04440 [Bacteroides sp.]|nr:hypothetical protein [Bacteroides sp.]